MFVHFVFWIACVSDISFLLLIFCVRIFVVSNIVFRIFRIFWCVAYLVFRVLIFGYLVFHIFLFGYCFFLLSDGLCSGILCFWICCVRIVCFCLDSLCVVYCFWIVCVRIFGFRIFVVDSLCVGYCVLGYFVCDMF